MREGDRRHHRHRRSVHTSAASRASTRRPRTTRSAWSLRCRSTGSRSPTPTSRTLTTTTRWRARPGPGEADYKQQLADYNTAFGTFFDRLKNDGIDKSNTLFIVTVDEGDHFAGGTGTPAADGSLTYAHTPCAPTLTTCPSNQIGEITTNLKAFAPAGSPTFDLHFDDAPTIYVNGQPSRTDPSVRKLERDLGAATAVDPYQGGATVALTQRLADPVEENTLHMVNADPKRTPTFTLFGNADFFFQASNSTTCGTPTQVTCVDPKFAWNHGDFQDEIANTWLGVVGPGVENNGIDTTTWTDHVDVRPTINAILGLGDDYVNDGRVITQILDNQATPKGLHQHGNTTADLGAMYKQINAPFGKFALDTLVASTSALKQPNTAAGNLKYDSIEAQIANLTAKRNVVAGVIRDALNNAAKGSGKLDESNAKDWITRARGCSTPPLRSRPRRRRPQPFHLGGLELAPGAGLEPSERQRAVAAAMQVTHAMTDRLEHAPHLPVAALVDRQLQLRAAKPPHLCRSGRAVVEHHSRGELRDRRIACT